MRKGKKIVMDRPKTYVAIALEDGMIEGATRVRHAMTARESRVIWGLAVMVLVSGLTTFGNGLSQAFTNVAAHL